MESDPTNVPPIFSGTLTLAPEIHNCNTRFSLDIHRQGLSINHGATTFLLQYQQAILSKFLKEALITQWTTHHHRS